jgi:hypothetical protein
MNRMPLPLVAVALAAGAICSDAAASAMKNSMNIPQICRKSASEPLPLLPPTFPSEHDQLLASFMMPNSVASQKLLIETRPPFSRATLAASTRCLSAVKPGVPLSVTMRSKHSQTTTETARFTLPEPASILLILTGVIGLTARRQMRRYSAKHV